MAKWLNVQIEGVDRTIRLKADEFAIDKENPDGKKKMAIRRDDKKIGEFRLEAIIGWWIEEFPD